MTLQNSNLYTESYNLVKAWLDSLNLDPRDRYKANWIHSSMPNISARGFEGYPFIILRVQLSEDKKSFDSSINQKIFRVLIQVYSDQATEVDTIGDSIRNGLDSYTDFQEKSIGSSDISYDLDMNGKKIIFRTLSIIMRSRI